MPSAQISNNIWFRHIHDTWENTSGYRTDIAKSVLNNLTVKQAAFVLDDERALFINMDDLRKALQHCSIRNNGKIVGPFNINPHTSIVNGQHVTIEIKFPKKS